MMIVTQKLDQIFAIDRYVANVTGGTPSLGRAHWCHIFDHTGLPLCYKVGCLKHTIKQNSVLYNMAAVLH